MLTTLTVDLTNQYECQDVIYAILQHRGVDALADIAAAMRKRAEDQRSACGLSSEVWDGVASDIEAWLKAMQEALCP